MIVIELCPHCGSKQCSEQPSSHRQSQVIFYECGNSITFNFGEHSELISHEDHADCHNKIDWTNILEPYNEEYDGDAKLIDERFFGWIELQFYQTYHKIGWKNKHEGKNCNDKEFLNKYFLNKEIYLRDVRNDNENITNQHIVQNIVSKDYEDWIGPVTLEEIHKSIDDDVETIVYMILSADWSPKYAGGYVVERNPIGGGDQGRDLYERGILDIIKSNENI